MANGDNGHQRYGGEFILVNLRNVFVPTFSGINLNVKPYMPFSKAMRKLTRAQGEDDGSLLEILNEIEKHGTHRLTMTNLIA